MKAQKKPDAYIIIKKLKRVRDSVNPSHKEHWEQLKTYENYEALALKRYDWSKYPEMLYLENGKVRLNLDAIQSSEFHKIRASDEIGIITKKIDGSYILDTMPRLENESGTEWYYKDEASK